MKQYQWKTAAEIISGGYPGEEYGVLGTTPDWTTTNASSGSTAATYYLTDSNSQNNANSSQVFVDISESWTASVDDLNNLSITLTTTVNRIYRGNIRGNPLIGGNATREFYLRREAGGTLLWSIMNDSIATAHDLMSSPLVLGQYTFTLPPGSNFERGSVYFRGNTNGHGGDPVPSFYVDEMWLGTYFRNILPSPTAYRITYDANGGSGAPGAQERTTAQETCTFVVPNTTPSWGLYEFLGWSTIQYPDSRTEADVQYRAGDSITLSQSSPTMTLYAVWRKDYRPHAILKNDGKWYSHNRPEGEAHILRSGAWSECRTIGAPTAKGNPPSVYHDGKWYNGARIGLGGA